MNSFKKYCIGWSISVFLLILCNGLLSGCATQPDYSKIPLTSGDGPYQMPPGRYRDTRGNTHIEQSFRWSVSEAWLYDAIKNTKPDKP